MKKNNIHKLINYESIVSLGLSFFLIGAFLCDIGVWNMPDIFVLQITNKEEMFLGLFGVQATIASVGIAIIALLSVVITENAYGICFARFIADTKPVFLKHRVLIILNLILIIVDCFAVAKTLFNLSIMFFVISVLISIRLVKDVYVVFSGFDSIRKQIYQFIIENYSENIIRDIYVSMEDLDNIKNLSRIRDNFELIEEVFKKELLTCQDDSNLEILIQIEKLSTDCSANMLKKTEPQLTLITLNHILNLYDIANSKEKSYRIYLWENISFEFFESIKNLTNNQLRESGVFYKFHKQLYYNKNVVSNNDDEINRSMLKNYSTWIYVSLKDNLYYHNMDFGRIAKVLYDNMISGYRFDDKLNDDNRKNILLESCVFAKTLVDYGDCENISKLYFGKGYYQDEDYEKFTLFVILIYLYYLIYREPLAEYTGKKAYAERILKDNINDVKSFLDTLDIVGFTKENLDVVRNLMVTWEVMIEGEVKTLIIDRVINDFFVFVVLSRYWSNNDINSVLCEVSPNTTFSIYTNYFSGKDNGFAKDFLEFQTVFGNDIEEVVLEEKVDLLRNVLYEKYKREEFERGYAEQITEDDLYRFESYVNAEIKNITAKYNQLFTLDENVTDTMIKTNCFMNIMMDSFFFRQNTLDSYVSRLMYNNIINLLLNELIDYVKLENVNMNDCDIQERFIQLIEDNNIIGDIYLGNKDRFWNEDNQNLLKEFVSNMNNIQFSGGYSHLFVIDSSTFSFRISNVRVEFEDLTDDEIEQKCITEDGVLKYNVTNDIYIPFEKSELTSHVNRIKKKAKIYLDYSCEVKGLVGAGIKIEKENH